MAMQISVDPSTLTTEQREAVADFILTFPAGVAAGKVVVDLTADTTKLHTAIAAIHDATISQDDLPSTGTPSAAEAFGAPAHTDPAAAAAFGSTPAPLPHGATAAPSTAAAAPSMTAPAVMPATTSAATLSVPVPPAPNAANVAQAAALPPASPAPGVEVDSKGLPWDARIHAESKNKIADGTWRKKRNLDPNVLATVEAELRQLMAAPGAAASPVAPAPAAPSAVPTAPAAPSAPAVGNVPLPPGVPVAPAAIPSATAASPQTATPAATAPVPPAANGQDPRAQFVALVGRASAAIQGGKVTQAEVNQCCANAGVPALPLLANRLDLVATVAASVDALIASRG